MPGQSMYMSFTSTTCFDFFRHLFFALQSVSTCRTTFAILKTCRNMTNMVWHMEDQKELLKDTA